MTDFGSFQLTDVSALPNVTVAFPGEHWSDRKASEIIVPGEAVFPINSGGKLYMRRAASAESGSKRMAIALHPITVPDINPGSLYAQPLGPNEIMNLPIQVGEYVHAYYAGEFHLTLVKPRAWIPGDMLVWDPNGTRPTGKAGSGSWDVTTNEALAMFEVIEFRNVNASNEGILTVRSFRTQD